MHKQLLNFNFEGSVFDNYDRLLISNWRYRTEAKSAKQALSNINFAAKKACKLEPTTLVKLSGSLHCENLIHYDIRDNLIQWPQDSELDEYTHELSTGARKLNKNANLPYYVDLFAFFGKDDFSREQFVWKLSQLRSTKPYLRKVSEENRQLSIFDYMQFSRSGNDTLEDDAVWIWDEDEGVYWKDGIKYGEYLTSLED